MSDDKTSCSLTPPPGYIAPATPADEAARLEEVRALNLLDSPAEERFDRIVRLTSMLFEAPISYVALIDQDRQWFKSKIGMEPEQTTRESSFCGHAILQDVPLIIPDARKDMRFAGNPLVIGEPFVRFYAGQPLRGPGGHKVGTLCILDRRARKITDKELLLLKELATLIEHEMELRGVIEVQKEIIKTREALDASQRELEIAMRELQLAKQRSDDLLENILPPDLAMELRDKGSVAPVQADNVAVLFADFAGFTKVATVTPANELVDELNECFCHFDWAMARHGCEKLKTIGDGYLAVAGLPNQKPDDALRLLRAAFEMRDFMVERRQDRVRAGLPSWEVRIGLHIGPLVAGVIGVRKIAYDVWGDTVNTASRVESAGAPGRINVTATFHERVKDQVVAEARGPIGCKNKGEVEMYFVNDLKE